MRTWALHTDDGRVFGFEISRTFITRGSVVRIVRQIPGAEIVSGARYSERRRDDFCHFTLRAEHFIAEEPYGDNSRFWIYAEGETGFSLVPTIQGFFKQRKLFGVM